MLSNKTKATVKKIPLLKVRAGPRDKEAWGNRLKEELKAMITVLVVTKHLKRSCHMDVLQKETHMWTNICKKFWSPIDANASDDWYAMMANDDDHGQMRKLYLVRIIQLSFWFLQRVQWQYVNNNKENDNDWFFITPNADGTQYAD